MDLSYTKEITALIEEKYGNLNQLIDGCHPKESSNTEKREGGEDILDFFSFDLNIIQQVIVIFLPEV
jgi:hypothetical protein